MNTPDTEWRSKSVEIWEGKETPKEIAHAVVTHFSDFISTKIEEDIETVIERLISSRDTYWKERVKQVSYEIVKEFQDSLITIAIKNEHMRGCVTSNQIIQAFKDFEASTHPILEITNEDNLK